MKFWYMHLRYRQGNDIEGKADGVYWMDYVAMGIYYVAQLLFGTACLLG